MGEVPLLILFNEASINIFLYLALYFFNLFLWSGIGTTPHSRLFKFSFHIQVQVFARASAHVEPLISRHHCLKFGNEVNFRNERPRNRGGTKIFSLIWYNVLFLVLSERLYTRNSVRTASIAVPTQGRPESGSCSFLEVSGRGKKDDRAKTQKFVVVYTPGMQWLVECGLEARLRIFLRFVPPPHLDKVIPEKLRESEVKMKTKVVASKGTTSL